MTPVLRASILSLLVLLPACAQPPASSAPAASPSVVYVFLLAGQSNMAGAGAVGDLLEPQRRTPPNVRLFEGGQFRELTYGKQFGPEVGFADGLIAAGFRAPIVLCKLAPGGTHLAGQWNPDKPDTLYARMFAQLNDLRGRLRAEGKTPVVAGFLWMQGERDARSKEMAQAYRANMANLLRRVRADVGMPDLPAVIGQISPRQMVIDVGPVMRVHAYRETVRAAQASVAASDPRAALVHTDDLSQFDNLHYDAAGQLELGRRFAQAYLTLQRVGKP